MNQQKTIFDLEEIEANMRAMINSVEPNSPYLKMIKDHPEGYIQFMLTCYASANEYDGHDHMLNMAAFIANVMVASVDMLAGYPKPVILAHLMDHIGNNVMSKQLGTAKEAAGFDVRAANIN